MTLYIKPLVAEIVPDLITDLPENSCLSEVSEDIKRLARLEPDWSDEGAPAINPVCISRAREFVQRLACEMAAQADEKECAPAVFPMIDGGLRLYWKTREQQMSLVFRPGQSSIEVIAKARGEASSKQVVSEAEAGELAVKAMQEGA